MAFSVLVGTRVIPRLLDYVAATRSRELFTLTVLVLALGIAVGSSLVFSVSMALGAFLAGMVVGRSEYSLRAASEALPMRDAFAVLFFVSVGMLLDPGALLDSPGLIAGALLIVLVGKPLVALLFVWAMRYPFRASLTVAIALAQIGEFSFILATLGRDLGVLTARGNERPRGHRHRVDRAQPVAYRNVRAIERWFRERPRLWAIVNRPAATPSDLEARQPRPSVDPAHRAVVIGYGPTGRTLVRLLRANEVAPTVIELNMDAVRSLRDEGVDAIYGDATRPETLEAAGVGRARILILGSAGMANSPDVIRAARALNPKVRVLARATYLRDLASLKAAGADQVYQAKARWRWPLSRTSSMDSAPPQSRSIANVPAPTTSYSSDARLIFGRGPVEVVLGRVGHQRDGSNVVGHTAARRGRHTARCVQPVDRRRLRERAATGRPRRGTRGFQEQPGDRAGFDEVRIGRRGASPSPHSAAIG